MTFEQINIFIAAAQSNTFLEAAEILHTTQSNLSKQIQKLESELNIQLFDRSKRKASLNEAGNQFYKDALILKAQYEHTLQNLSAIKHANDTRIRIGTLPILNQYQFTGCFKEFCQTYPDIQLDITEVEENDILAGIEQGLFDIIITRPNILKPANKFKKHVIANDTLVAVVPLEHPFSKKSDLTLTELSHENLILMNRYTAIYQLCITHFNKIGITPKILRTARIESIISAVSEGEGISLIAKSNLNVFQHEQIKAVPLKEPVELPVVIAYKKNDCLIASAQKLVCFFQKKMNFKE